MHETNGVIIPPTVKKIGDFTFYACEHLDEVDYSKCEADEGNGVFEGTPWWNEEEYNN